MSTVPFDGDDGSQDGESEPLVALFSHDHRGQFAEAFRRLNDPGFRWVGVEHYEQSLRELDGWPDVAVIPDDTGRPIDIVDARHWAQRLDGVRVSLCGQQHQLEQVASTDDHVEWVFRMESNQKRASAFVLVRAKLPISEAPPSEPHEHLTWASGYFVARGTAVAGETSNEQAGETATDARNCMYLVADHVFFTPKAKTRRQERGSLASRMRSALRRR